jgi:hypothetical protein
MKRNVKQMQGGWHLVLALAAPLVLLGTGCYPNYTSTPDAGGVDAGTDAGVSCDDLAHDAKLGTLRLEPGFAATESAELPPQIGAVTALAHGNSYRLYGLRNSDKSLYSLGTWPTVALGNTALVSVISEPDRTETTFLGGYLTNDGTRLLSGYTKPGTGFPGNVVIHDTVTPSNSTYLSAPGNFSAAAVPGAFLINGTGLGTSQGTAVHALKVDNQTQTVSTLATFPSTTAASGYTAVSTNGIAVLGYSVYPQNVLRAVPPAAYTAALSSGNPLPLGDWPEVYSGEDLFAAAGFSSGVALHRGSYDAQTFAPLTQDVMRVELTVDGSNPRTVITGGLTPVLTASNTCTQVDLLAPLGEDLLVGVTDRNGHRLVRLVRQ